MLMLVTRVHITQPLVTKRVGKNHQTSQHKKKHATFHHKKSHNLLAQKNHATSWQKKITESHGTKNLTQPLTTKKITQPLGAKKNHATSQRKKRTMQPLCTKEITQPLGTRKNHITSRHKTKVQCFPPLRERSTLFGDHMGSNLSNRAENRHRDYCRRQPEGTSGHHTPSILRRAITTVNSTMDLVKSKVYPKHGKRCEKQIT